jgi:hypothetical protein
MNTLGQLDGLREGKPQGKFTIFWQFCRKKQKQ